MPKTEGVFNAQETLFWTGVGDILNLLQQRDPANKNPPFIACDYKTIIINGKTACGYTPSNTIAGQFYITQPGLDNECGPLKCTVIHEASHVKGKGEYVAYSCNKA